MKESILEKYMTLWSGRKNIKVKEETRNSSNPMNSPISDIPTGVFIYPTSRFMKMYCAGSAVTDRWRYRTNGILLESIFEII